MRIKRERLLSSRGFIRGSSSPRPWRGRAGASLALSALILFLVPVLVRGEPSLHQTRIHVDGFIEDGEYSPDEVLFQVSPEGIREESTVDSKWGRYDDLNNIRVSWDAESLYVAVEGFIFDNNTMLFLDTLPLPDLANPGLTSLSQLNSWRRQVSFDNGFAPDLFLATWDNNTKPQIWQYQSPNNVSEVPQSSFHSVASFSRDLPGRALEAAIPWDVVFLGRGTREFREEYGDTVYVLPAGVKRIKVAGWITTGADGLGGPDSAPDNLSGHQVDSGIPVVLDNFLYVTLDSTNASGASAAPDGVPDFEVPVRTPAAEQTQEKYAAYVHSFFFFPPPVRGQSLQMDRLEAVDARGRPGPRAIAPELGDVTNFLFTVTPTITDTVLLATRRLDFTAQIYDLDGHRVRTIYQSEPFPLEYLNPDFLLGAGEIPSRLLELNRFDGRDDQGMLLDAGIYILRVVMEPLADEKKLAVVVVR